MGQRGIPPKPTALRVLHGDPKKRINKDEPTPEVMRLGPPPEHLSENQRAIWVRNEEQLFKMGLSWGSDHDLFATYCTAVDAWQEAVKMINEAGLLVRGANGLPVANPAVNVMDKTAAQIRSLATHFGLSPSARGGIKRSDAGAKAPGAERLFA